MPLDFRLMEKLYCHTGGEQWQPRDPHDSRLQPFVEQGYLDRADYIGEVRIPDHFMIWTEEAHVFMARLVESAQMGVAS